MERYLKQGKTTNKNHVKSCLTSEYYDVKRVMISREDLENIKTLHEQNRN